MLHLSFFRAANAPEATCRQLSWGDLAEALCQSCQITADKAAVPLWNASEFSPAYREQENFVRAHALILDIDDRPAPELDQLLLRLAGLAQIFYTTHRHGETPGRVRARVVVRLSRPVEAVEWPRFAVAVEAWLSPVIELDRKCLHDTARCYYLPSCDPARLGDRQAWAREGEALDVDELLAEAPSVASPISSPAPTSWRPEVTLTLGHLHQHAARRTETGQAARRIVQGQELAPKGARHHARQALIFALTVERGPCEPDEGALAALVASCDYPAESWLMDFRSYAMRGKAEARWQLEQQERAANEGIAQALIARELNDAGTQAQQLAVAPASGWTVKNVLEVSKRAKDPNIREVLRTIHDAAGVEQELASFVELAGQWLGRQELGRRAEDLKSAFVHVQPAQREAIWRGIDEGQQKALEREPWRLQCRMGQDGVIAANEANCLVVLGSHPDMRGVLAFDDRAATPVFVRSPPWPRTAVGAALEDADAQGAIVWLQEVTGASFASSYTHAALIAISLRTRFDPVVVYLEGLRWDGTPRLSTWLTRYCAAADSELHRAFARKSLVSCVARAYQPGCKVDTALILEGAQGAKKSSVLRALCPEARFFSDVTGSMSGDQKFLEGIVMGPWIVELGELAALSRADLNGTKQIMSRLQDRFRPAYGRTVQLYPRRVVFIGTTNQGEYLRDETGARRWWPVSVGQCDLGAVLQDRDQLWAEAVQAYKAGERWWFEAGDPLSGALAGAQEARREADPFEDELQELLTGPGPLSPAYLAAQLQYGDERRDQKMEWRLRRMLTAYGWRQDAHRSRQHDLPHPQRWWWRG